MADIYPDEKDAEAKQKDMLYGNGMSFYKLSS